jgi:hypothetical protein
MSTEIDAEHTAARLRYCAHCVARGAAWKAVVDAKLEALRAQQRAWWPVFVALNAGGVPHDMCCAIGSVYFSDQACQIRCDASDELALFSRDEIAAALLSHGATSVRWEDSTMCVVMWRGRFCSSY